MQCEGNPNSEPLLAICLGGMVTEERPGAGAGGVQRWCDEDWRSHHHLTGPSQGTTECVRSRCSNDCEYDLSLPVAFAHT